MSDSDDDCRPTELSPELLAALSPEARAALQEVMAARASEATGAASAADETPAGVSENWNLSQFWYSKATSNKLAAEILRAVEATGKRGPIACLSCPSTYMALKVRVLWLPLCIEALYGDIMCCGSTGHAAAWKRGCSV